METTLEKSVGLNRKHLRPEACAIDSPAGALSPLSSGDQGAIEEKVTEFAKFLKKDTKNSPFCQGMLNGDISVSIYGKVTGGL